MRGAGLVLAVFTAAACATRPAVERAQSLLRRGQEAEAAQVLRLEIAQHPDALEARKLLIRTLAASGELSEAIKEVEALAARLPAADPSPWLELGRAYELAHRWDEALAAYDEAADKAPASPAGPREGGLRAARWGLPEEARPRLEEALRRGARDGATHHALGLVCVHLGDLDAAEIAYKRGLVADGGALENWMGLATVAVLRSDGAAALRAYDAVLAQRPRYAPAHLGRAWSLARLGRVADARAALTQAEALGASKAHVERQRAALDGAR